jgi:hypothetical protein
MIDADLDHDEETQTGVHAPSKFALIEPERLAELDAETRTEIAPGPWVPLRIIGNTIVDPRSRNVRTIDGGNRWECTRCLASADLLADLAHETMCPAFRDGPSGRKPYEAPFAREFKPLLNGELQELLRLYRTISSVAQSVDQIERIGQALERQVVVAETAAESILRRAGQLFEILLRWGATTPWRDHASMAWHCTDEGLRWSGSFDEAVEIVRAKYGPKRGREAFIVVQVLEAQ